MAFSAKKTSSSAKIVLINLGLALLLVILILTGLFFWLRHYTQHGVEVEVPDITGMYQAEALTILQGNNLKMEIIDSTYSKKVPLGTIVEQNPAAGSHAKTDRVVYLIVNARNRKQVALPDLHDISFRQAEATLVSLGLTVNPEYEYEPSEYRDLILDIKYRGEVLQPGTRLEEGSEVTLVIGFGKGTEMMVVPSVIGKTLSEARAILLQNRLTVGAIQYDTTPEEGQRPLVYWQSPQPEAILLEGSTVNLRMSLDAEKVAIGGGENNNENDFF